MTGPIERDETDQKCRFYARFSASGAGAGIIDFCLPVSLLASHCTSWPPWHACLFTAGQFRGWLGMRHLSAQWAELPQLSPLNLPGPTDLAPAEALRNVSVSGVR